MQAVILAAGRGTRMKILTEKKPKPMLELAGKPLLEYKVDFLPSSVDSVVFVVGHARDEIQKFFGSTYHGKAIKYAVQEKLDGTYSALLAAKDILEDRFLVIMGDDMYRQADLDALTNHELALLATKNTRAMRTGILEINASGQLVAISENQLTTPDSLVNCGAYMLDRSIFTVSAAQLPNGEYGLPQTLVQLVPQYRIDVVYTDDWFPVTNPDDLRNAEQEIQRFYPN